MYLNKEEQEKWFYVKGLTLTLDVFKFEYC